MNLDITSQINLFLIFVLNGIIIGSVFDIFRILRKSFKTSNFMTYIEDILFWIITAFIIMYSIFEFNNGKFRGYIFIGIFLGIAFYMLFLSKYIIKISVKILLVLKRIFLFLYKVVKVPINFIKNLIIKLVINPANKILTNCCLFFKKVIKNAIKTKKNTKKLKSPKN